MFSRWTTKARICLSIPLALAASGALAYFTTTGAGAVSGGVTVLAGPTISSAKSGAGTVALTWTAVSAPGPGEVTYYVSRDGEPAEGNCPTSTSTSPATSCTDAGVAVGTHHYTVTAVWRSWTTTSAAVEAQIAFGAATHFLLTAVSTAPAAGVADNLTITAKDESNNTVTTYTGSHNLTFAGASAIGSFNPTVTSNTGVATSFGTATAITFTSGIATISGSNNGVMKLYKAELASIGVSDGSIANGTGLSVTVAAGTAASFSLAAASIAPTAGETDNLTITALDAYGNTAVSYTASHNITFAGATAIGAFNPTVTTSTGVATKFATATAIVFTSGIATVSGASNGAMVLYKTETASITATEGTIKTTTPPSITVSPAAPASLGLTATSTTPAAGATDNLTITAKDTYGNTVTSYTGTHNLTFNGANTIGAYNPTVTNNTGTPTNLGTTTAITFTTGTATTTGSNNGTLTLYKAEAAKITVTDGTLTNGTGLTITVSPTPATSLALTATTTTPTAGAADNLTITAKDTYGNTATTYTTSHNLTFNGANNSPNATHPTVSSSTGVATNFGTATAITFTSGIATISGSNNGVMKLYNPETTLLTVTDGTLTNGTGTTITVAAAAASTFSLTAASIAPTAGETDNLTITALDAYGNTAVSYTASHNITFAGATAIGAFNPTVTTSTGVATKFATATAIVFTSGIATVSGASNGAMVLYKTETASITATEGTIKTTTPPSITVSPAAPASLGLTATSTTPAAGATDNLTITAKDTYGNTVTSYTGTHNLTFNGANTIGAYNPTVTNNTGTPTNLGTTTAITFTTGTATTTGSNNGTLTLYKAEAAKITVTDGTLTNGTGLTITVSPTPATSLALTATTTTPTAGAADNLTITAKDTYGNTATTYTTSHNLTFNGANNSPNATHPTVSSSTGVATNFGTATAITFTSGIATISGSNNGVMKLYNPETTLLTVTDGTLTNGTGTTITVAAAAASTFSLTAASIAPTAGETDNLTITALDAYGNTAVSYTASHNITFAGATAIGAFNPTVTTSTGVATKFATATAIVFTSGIATVSGASNGAMVLYKTETASITATEGTIKTTTPPSITVSPAAPASLGLTATSTTPAAGATDNLTITAKDTYGNTVTSYTGTHNLTFNGANTIGAYNPTVTNNTGTPTNLGTTTAITFTTGTATTTGSNNGTLTLYKAEAAKITVTDGTLTNGTGLTITVSPTPAASLALTATTTTPTAGAADNLTITAKDTYGNTATTYTTSHNLTFNGANAIGAFSPTVSSSTGTATNFGTATAITFTSGIATVSGSNNGAMKLYQAETTLITVTDGTLTNGTGLSVTVAAAAAASFSMTAATVTPTAGEADNLAITALDAYGNTAVSYTASHNLTFTGASTSPNANHPTVSSGAGTATNFGTAEAITFTNGIATVAGTSNGVMTLYNVETAKVIVTSSTVTNGTGLVVTVATATPTHVAWTHVTVSAGTLSSPCAFTCTVTALGAAGTFTANVSVTDSFGNTVSGVGAGHTVTVSTPSSGGGSGGTFTEPAAGTSVNLSISSAGAADSTAQFIFKAQSGVWTSDTMTAQTLAGTTYTSATATLNK